MSARWTAEDLDLLGEDVEEIAAQFAESEAAEGLEAEAARLGPGVPPRAEVLRFAAEAWRRRRRYAEAERCARAALADGGPTWVDARVDLVGVLLVTDPAAAHEVLAELRRSVRQGPYAHAAMEMVADDLYAAGWHREAARWYTMLLDDTEPEDLADGGLSTGPAVRRRLSREALGKAPDAFDRASARSGAGSRLDWSYRPAVLLVWPDDELATLLDRWPDLGVLLEVDPDQHRRRALDELEGYADLVGEDPQVRVVAGRVDGLLAHARAHGTEPRHAETRSGYAAALAAEGAGALWRLGQPLPAVV